MNIKENIESMLDAIANKDAETASNIFSEVMTQKAAERLDAYKVDVADSYFNGFKEGAHEDKEDNQ